MSDNLSQAVDLLTLCLGGATGQQAGAVPNTVFSEQLNVWAVVDVRECGGDCPVRERVAREAGNVFGQILSGHLRLELGLLSIACRATGEEPRELLRQVLAEAADTSGPAPAPGEADGVGATTDESYHGPRHTTVGDRVVDPAFDPVWDASHAPDTVPARGRAPVPGGAANIPHVLGEGPNTSQVVDPGHVRARDRMLLDRSAPRTD